MAISLQNIMKLPVNIKKKQTTMPVYAATSVVMLCIALFCLFTPFISPFSTALSKNMLTAYMILGGVTTMFFAFVTAYTVFSIISPPIGITVSEEGIYEYTVAGCGAGFIPKEAIVSLKTYGVDKKQYLGINVASAYVGELGEKACARREIMNNVEAGAPAVIIRQSDIYITVNKLLKLLLEAYGTQNATPRSAAPAPLADDNIDKEIPTPAVKQEPKVTDRSDDINALFKVFEEKNAKQAAETKADDDIVIKTKQPEKQATAAESPAPDIISNEQLQDTTPPPSVIKTVDELLAQLNIPVKHNKDGK